MRCRIGNFLPCSRSKAAVCPNAPAVRARSAERAGRRRRSAGHLPGSAHARRSSPAGAARSRHGSGSSRSRKGSAFAHVADGSRCSSNSASGPGEQLSVDSGDALRRQIQSPQLRRHPRSALLRAIEVDKVEFQVFKMRCRKWRRSPGSHGKTWAEASLGTGTQPSSLASFAALFPNAYNLVRVSCGRSDLRFDPNPPVFGRVSVVLCSRTNLQTDGR